MNLRQTKQFLLPIMIARYFELCRSFCDHDILRTCWRGLDTSTEHKPSAVVPHFARHVTPISTEVRRKLSGDNAGPF
jgi:hypothetical protein